MDDSGETTVSGPAGRIGICGAELFHPIQWELLREMRFRMCLTRHGGSGLNMSYEYADKMEIQALRKEYDRLADHLQKESDAYNTTPASGRKR